MKDLSNSVIHATTTAIIRKRAGRSLLARLIQNSPSLRLPVAALVPRRRSVIRYPLKVKKTPTPSNPPGAQPKSRW
jgi:hypothetical protein